LRVYHSNRLEHLAARLAGLLGEPMGDWATPETVVVQSQGMQRWLDLMLARHLGISANLVYPFPASFVWTVYRSLVPSLPEHSGYDREPLFWRLLACLEAVPEDAPSLAGLRHFLAPTDAWERAELAARLAGLLDRYQVFRPDWIDTWDRGDSAHWQGWLWRRLLSPDDPHRVRLHRECLARLQTLHEAPPGLPARVSVFGISALPPLYLQVLQAIAHLTEVHLFLLNPCEQYWGLIQAERDIARQYGDDPETIDSYFETGNRLLASMGRLGRDTHYLLIEIEADPLDLFESPGEDSLLHCLQQDILQLENRGDNRRLGESAGPPLTTLDAADTSVRIQVCHTAMREVEVLHDQLLALLAERPGLTAADIVVMTPDIERYAPAIRAVFATAEPAIPFSVADRRPVSQSPLVEAFLGILDLCDSRFPVDRVLRLLECGSLRGRFGLSEADLPLITGWLRDTAVRWGVDAAGRSALDLPATPEHTWRAGLERLLLGFALPAREQALYREILPFDGVEGDGARVMGRLVRFIRVLVAACEDLQRVRSPAAWEARLGALLEEFFADDDASEAERELLRVALALLAASADEGGFGAALDLGAVRYWLLAHLSEADAGGFLGAGVTFCTLMPMRSVPFRVVCLIGLNDGSFPRPQTTLDIDLMAKKPRRGDRTRRWEDRYLFLEALLSAREVLYLSFVGRSVRDNAPIPPAVLVSELLDYIQQGFRAHDGGDPLEQIGTEHPLQSFSPRYFGDEPRLFSYAAPLCEAIRERAGGEVRALWSGSLAAPEALWQTVELERLLGFFQHPARFLLRERLAALIPEQVAPPEPREPFLLEPWVDARIRQRILAARDTATTPAELLPLIRAAGLLPHGTLGELLYWREAGIVRPLARALEQAPPGLPGPPAVDLSLGGFRLHGWLDGITAEGRLAHGVHPLNARQRLRLWIQHLVLNCLGLPGVAPRSRWLGLGEPLRLRPVANADDLLRALLELYWAGLSEPLPVFPRSGWAWLEAGPETGLEKAWHCWHGGFKQHPESQDPYYQLLYREHDPIDGRFAELAARIWLPLGEHSETE